MIKREKGRRIALLTDREKEHLSSNKSINQKTLSKIRSKLDKRLDALVTDLELIRKSSHLEVWRELQAINLNSAIQLLDFSFGTTHIYPFPIKFYTRNGERVYWLDKSDRSTRADHRLFEPDYALRKIKNPDARDNFSRLINSGIWPPEEKDKAVSVKKMKARLKTENTKQHSTNAKWLSKHIRSGKYDLAIPYTNQPTSN